MKRCRSWLSPPSEARDRDCIRLVCELPAKHKEDHVSQKAVWPNKEQ